MQNELIVQSIVSHGHLSPDARGSIIDALQRMEGKIVRVVIKEVKKRRSLSQNAFYWGVVVPKVKSLLESFGNNVNSEETHEFLKKKVAKMELQIDLPDGIQIVTASSTKLTTGEWENFIEKIRVWAIEFDLEIPFPHEVYL